MPLRNGDMHQRVVNRKLTDPADADGFELMRWTSRWASSRRRNLKVVQLPPARVARGQTCSAVCISRFVRMTVSPWGPLVGIPAGRPEILQHSYRTACLTGRKPFRFRRIFLAYLV
eukprot:scaffold318888_cov44-Prasinocladus_malaysianus.AAC.1